MNNETPCKENIHILRHKADMHDRVLTRLLKLMPTACDTDALIQLTRLESALAESEKAREEERESYQEEIQRWYDKLEASDARVAQLEEALDTLSMVVGLTPIAGNNEALQKAYDLARKALTSSPTGIAEVKE